MQSNHIPVRTCVGCRAKKSQSGMIRISSLKSGEIRVNAKEGRGAYICKDKKCLETAMKKGGIARALRCQVRNEVYDELLKLFGE